MRIRKAEALRFAILTARVKFESGRLTDSQMAILATNDPTELMIGDRWTTRAHDRELAASKARWLKWDQFHDHQR